MRMLATVVLVVLTTSGLSGCGESESNAGRMDAACDSVDPSNRDACREAAADAASAGANSCTPSGPAADC